MRSLILISGFLAMAAPAAAQAIQCEGSVENSVGEVFATYDLDRGTGKVEKQIVSYVPERTEGAGEESGFFPRPRLMFDYRPGEAGQLEGPIAASVLIGRYSAVGAGKPPPLSEVKVRVLAPPAEPLSWKASEPSGGEGRFAALMREIKPPKVTVELLGKDGKVLASAEFNLSKTAQFQKAVAQARAEADKRAAAYQKLASAGKAQGRCPVG
jgi:hypothetical protein